MFTEGLKILNTCGKQGRLLLQPQQGRSLARGAVFRPPQMTNEI